MSLLPITLACGPYDRSRALADGRVTVAVAESGPDATEGAPPATEDQ